MRPFGKLWRRLILPLAAVGLSLWGGYQLVRVLLAGTAEAGVNWLGYGEKKPLWQKLLVSLSLGLPAVVLNWHVWFAPLYTLLLFGIHYWLSRRFNWWWWGLVEIMAGFAQGSMWVIALLHP